MSLRTKTKDFAKQRFNTPYACNVIVYYKCINDVFIALLNYMQYKLAFIHQIYTYCI